MAVWSGTFCENQWLYRNSGLKCARNKGMSTPAPATMPAHVPPCPVTIEVLDEMEGFDLVVVLIVLRLLAMREMDGPASTNSGVLDCDNVRVYWTNNGNCQRSAVVCSKL